MKKSFPRFRTPDYAKQLSHFTKTEADLLLNLIQLDPARRYNARQALFHPYF